MAAYKIITTDSKDNVFTAESFLNHFRKSNSMWWNTAQRESSTWVFRGQRESGWGLVPTAFRPSALNSLNPLVEKMKRDTRFPGIFETYSDGKKEAIHYFSACGRAIREFYKLSLEIGLTEEIVPPNDLFPIPEMKDANSAFRFKNIAYYKLCSLQITGLAQHHGIPTPFIDWTKKPEVALHFAADLNNVSKDGLAVFALNTGVRRTSSVVYDSYGANSTKFENILTTRLKDKGPIELPFKLRLDPPAKNSYLAAQHGIFTLATSLSDYIETGQYTPLESDISNWAHQEDTILKKFILPNDEIKNLRSLLDREGITDAYLKPSFETTAEFVKSRW